MKQRAKIGDIVEITTPSGRAYAQFTHKHPMFGQLLSVYSRVPLPDEMLEAFALQLPQFLTFFPLQPAINQGIVRIVGSAPVPETARSFPLFRAAMRDPSSGRVAEWWLWDGATEWCIGKLSSEQRSLPIREVINDTMLVDRVISGWRAESET